MKGTSGDEEEKEGACESVEKDLSAQNTYDPLSNKGILEVSEKILKKNFDLGEEGYDIARDEGKVKPSKNKKDGTTMPVSDEVKKTEKKSKGKSAVELVKASYGKSVMNGKKKANEELDLTKVAEAFGGYIVEANGKKKSKNERSLDRFTDPRITKNPFYPPSDEEAARLKFEIDKKNKVTNICLLDNIAWTHSFLKVKADKMWYRPESKGFKVCNPTPDVVPVIRTKPLILSYPLAIKIN